MFPSNIHLLTQELLMLARQKNYCLTSAESCTGGLLMGALTEIPGASDVIFQGLIAYHNHSKQKLLAVRAQTLQTYGAVSAECALEMAQGAWQLGCDNLADNPPVEKNILAIAVTGIAGSHIKQLPEFTQENNNTDKPDGLVYIALSDHDIAEMADAQKQQHIYQHHFSGDRLEIRQQIVAVALQHAYDYLKTR